MPKVVNKDISINIGVNLQFQEANIEEYDYHTTQVRAGDRTLNEFGRLLKFVSGTPGMPSGVVKWSTS